MADEQQYTDDELRAIKEAVGGYGAPVPEEKHNVHTFLNTVAKSNDTTKTGNLDTIELGATPYSERTYKTLQLTCRDFCNDDLWETHFANRAEILSSTSLSKNAKLINLAVIQKREVADVTEVKKENSSWFKKKNNNSTTTTSNQSAV